MVETEQAVGAEVDVVLTVETVETVGNAALEAEKMVERVARTGKEEVPKGAAGVDRLVDVVQLVDSLVVD